MERNKEYLFLNYEIFLIVENLWMVQLTFLTLLTKRFEVITFHADSVLAVTLEGNVIGSLMVRKKRNLFLFMLCLLLSISLQKIKHHKICFKMGLMITCVACSFECALSVLHINRRSCGPQPLAAPPLFRLVQK